jgi:hypothetical protein
VELRRGNREDAARRGVHRLHVHALVEGEHAGVRFERMLSR